jgi:UDP-glucose 4-epimerase
VVQANLKAFEFKGNGAFNVGTGRKTTFNEVIAILNKLLGSDRPTDYFDNPYGFYQEATQADPAQARRILGFEAAYPPDRGIADYVEFLKTNSPATMDSLKN